MAAGAIWVVALLAPEGRRGARVEMFPQLDIAGLVTGQAAEAPAQKMRRLMGEMAYSSLQGLARLPDERVRRLGEVLGQKVFGAALVRNGSGAGELG
ncbi:MAG: hypothetical protein ABI072_08605 [Edaphobacter sp.]